MWRKRKAPERVPHPDPRIELELQRILALRAAAGRTGKLIEQQRQEIGSARREQEEAGDNLRGTYANQEEIASYEAQMSAQRDRITAARLHIAEAEEAIAAAHERAAELAGKLSDTDLAYL